MNLFVVRNQQSRIKY